MVLLDKTHQRKGNHHKPHSSPPSHSTSTNILKQTNPKSPANLDTQEITKTDQARLPLNHSTETEQTKTPSNVKLKALMVLLNKASQKKGNHQ